MRRPLHLAQDGAMDTLMRMQNSHDIATARKRAAEIKVAPFEGAPVGVRLPLRLEKWLPEQ